jgi:hypothetical protein
MAGHRIGRSEGLGMGLAWPASGAEELAGLHDGCSGTMLFA